ncbi:hypothetical protein P3589_22540 [Vibrio parahaemolyticus]|nr:hypothetical protein [Vibrio parahaemolyticus]MDF5014755.1 hypothetical protein [Vibrio parahaemolyticus]HCG7776394.1 hypothetical protein [Vibrio parahaemolyticus]
MYQLVFLIIVIVVLVYGFIGENTYHKPKFFIVLGFAVCLISVLFIDLALLLSSKEVNLLNDRTTEFVKNIITVSLAALGGGLMSTGFVLSAQKKHNQRNYEIQKRAEDLENQIEELQKKIDACDLINKDEEKVKFVNRLVELDEKLTDSKTELSKRAYL